MSRARRPSRVVSVSTLGAALLLPLLVAFAPFLRAQESAKARLAVASDPVGATVVLFATKDGSLPPRGSPDAERILGRTPLDVELDAGRAVVAVVKEGFVLKLEPLELRAGAAQRLEVRLPKDVPIPGAIQLKEATGEGATPLAKTQAQAEQLVDMVLQRVVALFVDEKDPRALVDAACKTTVAALEAVREREALLRRELGDEARARFYTEEVDLRAYPELTLAETPLAEGRKRYSLAAGSIAVEGVTDPSDFDSYRRKLHAVYSFVKRRWDTAGKLDDSALGRAFVEAMLGALDDAHTHFLPPAAFKDMNDETSGHFGGVGIVVAARDGHLVVMAPMEGTPGEKAGILAGDRILALDGRPTDGMSLSEAVKSMRGEPETTVELTLQRGEAAPWKVKLTRANIAIKFTKSELLEAPRGEAKVKVGYLRITSFMSDKLEEDVGAALDDLEARGARGIVIDLRNNPGGLLAKAVAIADMWVPDKGLIVETRGRIPLATKMAYATDAKKRAGCPGQGDSPRLPPFPIAVLINEGSASASEVLAGTLREWGLATLVGEKSFGKGSVQRVIPLEPFESALALTIATYHFKSGFTPHKKGLVPDVVVALTEDEKLKVASRSVYGKGDGFEDRQLTAALSEVVKKLP